MGAFLLVAPIFACRLDTGGGQRTAHVCRALAALGEVDVLVVSEPVFAAEEAEIDAIRAGLREARSVRIHRVAPSLYQRGPGWRGTLAFAWRRARALLQPPRRLYAAGASGDAALRQVLEEGRHDAIVGRYLKTTARSGALHQSAVAVLVDLDDIEEIVAASRRAAPGTPRLRRWVLAWQQRRTAPVVQALRERAAHLWVASADDLALVRHPSVSVLPNVPLLSSEAEAAPFDAASRTVLFVGSFIHEANRLGVERFVAAVWPRVVAAVPEACFTVVGSGGWEGRRAAWGDVRGVRVVGRVASVADAYAAALFCVVPVAEGSGTKIKALEALRHGRGVVAHRHAARGFGAAVTKGMVVVDDDAAMAEACIALLRDPAEAAALAARSVAAGRAAPSFSDVAASVAEAVAASVPSRRAR